MPRAGKAWRHITISTLNSWLPGDPRGWRSRHHKRHSSGDYKAPPPADEHAGLHCFAKSVSGDPIILPRHLRKVLGESIRTQLEFERHTLLVIAVGGLHTHMLVELPCDITCVRKIVGDAKSIASRSVRKELPGRVWGGGGDYHLVRDAAHQAKVYTYIRDHVDQGAWVWTFREGVVGKA